MMQKLSNFTRPKGLSDHLYGFCYRFGYFDSEQKDYMAYKLDSVENFSETRLKEMKVLELLEQLGFSMQEFGTYLYKNMIMKAIHHLNGFDNFNNPISQEKLLMQMKSPFSQFYVDVARNDLDMGIKTFHSHIENALNAVDYSKADASLLFEIYSNFSGNTDYGEYAFTIGKYVVDMTQKKTETQVVKQITMVPVAGTQVG